MACRHEDINVKKKYLFSISQELFFKIAPMLHVSPPLL